jgi:hypothetical protein
MEDGPMTLYIVGRESDLVEESKSGDKIVIESLGAAKEAATIDERIMRFFPVVVRTVPR